MVTDKFVDAGYCMYKGKLAWVSKEYYSLGLGSLGVFISYLPVVNKDSRFLIPKSEFLTLSRSLTEQELQTVRVLYGVEHEKRN